MAGTTTNGFPYPESTDFVTDGAQAIEDLAVEVDARLGMYKVIPTGATGGTVAANGDITIGTAQSELIVTAAFNSNYANYKILLQGGSTSASNPDLRLQLRTSAGVNSITGYTFSLIYVIPPSGSPTSFNQSNVAQFSNIGAGVSTHTPNIDATLLSPNEARGTICTNTFVRGTALGYVNGYHDVATAYNSFRLFPSSGTFSGCIVRIYGYN